MPCTLGLSRILPECLAERNLTFYYVRLILTTLMFTFLIVSKRLDRLHASTSCCHVTFYSRSSLLTTVGQFTLVFFPALIGGRLFDLGYVRGTLLFASINLVACTFSIAESHQFWQLLLCQGFGIGVSLQKSLSFSKVPTVWYS